MTIYGTHVLYSQVHSENWGGRGRLVYEHITMPIHLMKWCEQQVKQSEGISTLSVSSCVALLNQLNHV